MNSRTRDLDPWTRVAEADNADNYVDRVSRPVEASLLDRTGLDRVRVLSHSQLEAVIGDLASRRFAEKVEAMEAERAAERLESNRLFEEALGDLDGLRSELRGLLEDWRRKCASLREGEATRKRHLDERLRRVGDGFERIERCLVELESRPEPLNSDCPFPPGASVVADVHPAVIHAPSSSSARRHAGTTALMSPDVVAASAVIDLEFPGDLSVTLAEEITDDRNDEISSPIHVVGCRPAPQRKPHGS